MTQSIRTRSCPGCFLCGATGEVFYTNLTDRSFNVPGVWQIKRCPQAGCGLLWLDPMPVEPDIPLIYEDYFTHQDKASPPRGVGRRLIHWLYRGGLWATGLAHHRSELFSLYLRRTRSGRLLDVGCGDGARLARWQAMGWEVEGQEVDAIAAERARTSRGLRVHLGSLQDVALPEASVDAITISHVIEHVHDPVALLKECRRILKHRGRLIAVTPNINSFGHQRFGSCWRELDPPRHLHLFSPMTLRQVADRAGFRQGNVWTTAANAQFVAEGSLCVRRRGRHEFGARLGLGLLLQTLLFQVSASTIVIVDKDSGEECVLEARK